MTIDDPTVVYGTLIFLGVFTLVVLLLCQLSLQQVRAIRSYWRKRTTWKAYKQLVVDIYAYLLKLTEKKKKLQVDRRRKTISKSFVSPDIAETFSNVPEKSQRRRRTGVILNDPPPPVLEKIRDRSTSFRMMSHDEPVHRKLTAPINGTVGCAKNYRKLSVPAFDSVTHYKNWSEWMVAQEQGNTI